MYFNIKVAVAIHGFVIVIEFWNESISQIDISLILFKYFFSIDWILQNTQMLSILV